MAEKVIVQGGGDFDGAKLDNAASEATLLRLVEALEKGGAGGGGSGGAGGATNRLQALYNRTLGSSNSALGTLGDSFNAATSAINSATGSITDVLGKGFGLVVSGASFAIGSLTKYLTDSYTEFKKLSEVGANFSNNMMDASKFALNAGMSLRGFSDLVTKNNTVLMSLGGTATEGAKKLANLSTSLSSGDVGASLYGLGLTTQDIDSYMGSYLTQQQRLGSLEKKTQKELEQGTQAYIEELDKVAKLTGIERKRLDDQAKKQSLDPVINLMKRGLDPKELAKGTANLAMVAEIGGKDLEDAIKEIATGVVRSPLALELQSAGALTQKAAEGLIKGEIDAGSALQDMGRTLDKSNRYNNKSILQGNERLNRGAAMRDTLLKVEAADLKKRDEEAAKRSALTTAFGQFPKKLDIIFNKLLGKIVDNPLFDTLTKILESGAQDLEKYFDPIVDFFGDIAGTFMAIATDQGELGGIKNAFAYIGETLKIVFTEQIVPEAKKMIKDMFGIDFGELNLSKMAGKFFTGMFDDTWTSFQLWIRDAIGSLVTGAGIGAALGGLVGSFLGPGGTIAGAITGAKLGALIAGLLEGTGFSIYGAIKDGIQWVADSITEMWDGAVGKLGDWGGSLSKFWDDQKKAVGDLVDSISFEGIKQYITEKFNKAMDGMKSFFGFFSDLPLMIEKAVSDAAGGGRIASMLGLRSVADIDKELDAKKAARAVAPTASLPAPPTATPPNAQTALQQQTPEQKAAAEKAAAEAAKKAATPAAPPMMTLPDPVIAALLNSPSVEEAKQLNTLIEQLVQINREQLAANLDLMRATKGTYHVL